MTEAAAQVAQAASGILDAHVPGVPREIADVVKIRSAARRIMEADLEDEDQDRLLRGLAPRAARTALPLWSLEAILREIRHEPEPEIPLTRERAARRLRGAGYSTCPVCTVPVLADLDIERAERRAREAEQGREIHRRAVKRAAPERKES